MSVTEAQRIIDLRQQLTEHSFRYYVSSSPIISDPEYDTLFRELLELEKRHPELADLNSPTARVGSPIPSSLRKIKHKVKMLSLDNLATTYDIMKFFGGHDGEEITMEMKIDGMSLDLSYEKGQLVQAVTRGDGTEGEDITENARTIRTIPLTLLKPVSTHVRGEVYWRLSSFVRHNQSVPESKRYANPRNATSGVMRQHNSTEVSKCHLDFVAYAMPTDLPAAVETQEIMLEYLESLGFRSTLSLDTTKDMYGLPYFTAPLDPDAIEDALQYMAEYRKALDLDTDGVVLKLSSLAVQRDLGEGERSPHWGAAFKFPPETKATKLLEVTVQVGKTGQITPVAQLEPVSIGGAVVQRASLCNQDELNRLGIDIGDYVIVQKSGEVIPKIIGLDRPAPTKPNPNNSFQLPKKCPCCKTPLVRLDNEVHTFCPNHACYDQVFARLVYAVSDDALDIDGCGEVGVQTLISKAGVKQLSDMYKLKNFDFFKPAQRKRVQESLQRSKKGPLWRKISAFNINGIGKISAQDMATKYGDITAMYNDEEGLKKVIGPVAASTFRRWIEENMLELEELTDAGVSLSEDKKAAGPLSGLSFCITGRLMSGARDTVSALIESYGGTVKGAVTKKCGYLISGPGGGLNKSTDAAKYGVPLLTEEALYSMIGIPMPIMPQMALEE